MSVHNFTFVVNVTGPVHSRGHIWGHTTFGRYEGQQGNIYHHALLLLLRVSCLLQVIVAINKDPDAPIFQGELAGVLSC